MKRFSLALLCATGLNAEIYIYNSQTEQPLTVADKPFIASHEIGNIAFATSRGDNGEIKSLNSDGTPLTSIVAIRKALIKKDPIKKIELHKNTVKSIEHTKIQKAVQNKNTDTAKYLIH
jgi:hypothetical protein